jgi:hypothetical protein
VIKATWKPLKNGPDAIKYMDTAWVNNKDWGTLWPMWNRNFAHQGKDATNNAEAIFGHIKHNVFDGKRSQEMRLALSAIVGLPSDPRSQVDCMVAQMGRRLRHLTNGARASPSHKIQKRRQAVKALVEHWVATPDSVKVVDPFRMVLEVRPAPAKHEYDEETLERVEHDDDFRYLVNLSSSVCSCAAHSAVCKHILGARWYALVAFKIRQVWFDCELETVMGRTRDGLLQTRAVAFDLAPAPKATQRVPIPAAMQSEMTALLAAVKSLTLKASRSNTIGQHIYAEEVEDVSPPITNEERVATALNAAVKDVGFVSKRLADVLQLVLPELPLKRSYRKANMKYKEHHLLRAHRAIIRSQGKPHATAQHDVDRDDALDAAAGNGSDETHGDESDTDADYDAPDVPDESPLVAALQHQAQALPAVLRRGVRYTRGLQAGTVPGPLEHSDKSSSSSEDEVDMLSVPKVNRKTRFEASHKRAVAERARRSTVLAKSDSEAESVSSYSSSELVRDVIRRRAGAARHSAMAKQGFARNRPLEGDKASAAAVRLARMHRK